MKTYTESDWIKDKTFKASNYSIVDESIYNNFLNSLPPIWIKNLSNLSDIIEFDTGIKPTTVTRAFHNSEPTRHEKNFLGEYVPLYNTFAYIDNVPVYLGEFPAL